MHFLEHLGYGSLRQNNDFGDFHNVMETRKQIDFSFRLLAGLAELPEEFFKLGLFPLAVHYVEWMFVGTQVVNIKCRFDGQLVIPKRMPGALRYRVVKSFVAERTQLRIGHPNEHLVDDLGLIETPTAESYFADVLLDRVEEYRQRIGAVFGTSGNL